MQTIQGFPNITGNFIPTLQRELTDEQFEQVQADIAAMHRTSQADDARQLVLDHLTVGLGIMESAE